MPALSRTLAALLLASAIPLTLAAQEPATPPEPAPPAEEPAEPEPSLAEILGLAGDDRVAVLGLGSHALPDASLDQIRETIDEVDAALGERANEARARLKEAIGLQPLVAIENEWLREHANLERWRDSLTARAKVLRAASADLDAFDQRWRRAGELAAQYNAPPAVREQIQEMLASAGRTGESLNVRWGEVLSLEARVSGALSRTAEMIEAARGARIRAREALLATGELPTWQAVATGDIRAGTRGDAVGHKLRRARDYASHNLDRIALHLLLFVAALLATLSLRSRAPRWAGEDDRVAATARLLERPVASAIVLAWSPTTYLYPDATIDFRTLMALPLVLAFARLVPALVEARGRPVFYAIVVFFLVDVIRDALASAPLVERVTFEVELLAASLLVTLFIRSGRLADIAQSPRAGRVVVVLARIFTVLLGVALVASVFGYRELATLVGSGALRGLYTGAVFYSMYRLASGLTSVALRTASLQRLNLVRRNRSLVTARIISGLRLLLAFLWLSALVRFFDLGDLGYASAAALLGATLAVGSLSISLGDVVALVVALVGALYLSRFVRFVLEEDVVSRVDLPRGVPHAISVTAGYVVLFIGFLIALAAAGIDLSQFTILAGAFGVGIGFGMQNVVNNFVSGLILIFERPIQSSDVIEVGTLLGRVTRIGIRSSTVRTLQGAEVIVPNGLLISDQVVNWTLSDRQRRIDLPVGVEYGTDPERVRELLQKVAADDDRILGSPEPVALFLGFGDSSLDFELRAWTAAYDSWIEIRSDLAVAVNAALHDEGITIPFPQRDLHVRSVDPEASRALGTAPASQT